MARRLLRVALAVPLLAVGLGTASAAAPGGPAAPLCAHAASAHHAAIVVEHGNGRVVRQCVGFATPTITALAVLQASGIENATQTYGGLGAAVCQIDDEPTSYTQCLPSSGSYWVFFVSRAGGAWTNSPQGVSNTSLSDGDAAGFRFDPLAGADPPPVSPVGTCSTTTPPPTPTPRPTAPPTPKPTPAATVPTGGTAGPATQPRTAVTPGPATSSAAAAIAAARPTATAGGTGSASPVAAGAHVSNASPATASSGLSVPGLVLATGVVGALLVLLGVQGIRRRQR